MDKQKEREVTDGRERKEMEKDGVTTCPRFLEREIGLKKARDEEEGRKDSRKEARKG